MNIQCELSLLTSLYHRVGEGVVVIVCRQWNSVVSMIFERCDWHMSLLCAIIAVPEMGYSSVWKEVVRRTTLMRITFGVVILVVLCAWLNTLCAWLNTLCILHS